ncbi:hypothetical protein PGIGA_G00113330 [Pangasianodon gigas]|uniref:Uncharacterized protein n=1 Tax=Pangasianodon gigas TaxID=30993 RepID=A0ACC5W9H0_PANGG|nr:hypothetical protein [Pangasianodon gigas]
MPLPAMKVDLKSLGTIQTMIGAVIFMFGIVTQSFTTTVSVNSGVMYWGSLCVKSSLVMNLISTLAAIVALIVLFVDVVRMSGELPPCEDPAKCALILLTILLRGTFRVLLVFSVLEICASIWTFVLTWKTRDSLEATKDARRVDKLVQKASSVTGMRFESLEAVVERCTQKKLEAILEYPDHPLHNTLMDQRSSCSGRLTSVRCRTERYRSSFIPTAIRLYNTLANGR